MSIQDMILNEVRALRKEVKELRQATHQEEWISEKEAAAILGMSPNTLRQMRYDGRVATYRVRPTGRGVQYQKSELQNQFINNKPTTK